MKNNDRKPTAPTARLPKCPTGIQGLDEITGGGLPRGRPTLVCGGAGCGKTLLAVEFLVRGAVQFDEPGVLMAFEETEAELKANVASLGFDLAGLVRRKKIVLDYVHIERSEIQETGEYDLEGLFVRLNLAIDSIGAKRVVLDTLEALFAGLPNEAILRAELRRLFRWLKDKGVTAVITAERGREHLTRHGLEEYVSDCVILLDHRVNDQIATRHLRVVKYRGALHGTNEFPFLIGDDGLQRAAHHVAGAESQGVERADFHRHPAARRDAGREGLFPRQQHPAHGHAPAPARPSSPPILPRPPPGAGSACSSSRSRNRPTRSSATCIPSVCAWSRWSSSGLLRFHSARPTLYGLEMHLATMFKEIAAFQPARRHRGPDHQPDGRGHRLRDAREW